MVWARPEARAQDDTEERIEAFVGHIFEPEPEVRVGHIWPIEEKSDGGPGEAPAHTPDPRDHDRH